MTTKNTKLPKPQQVKNKLWKDDNGYDIPVNRITALEKKRERYAHKLLDEAVKLNEKLAAFKGKAFELSNEIFDLFMQEKKVSPTSKGNFVWYDFDRRIRIEVDNKQSLKFDDLAIEAAKVKMHQFLKEEITSENAYIKEMAIDAFQTRRGKLDVKKILGMLKYRGIIPNPLFNEALDLIEQGIIREGSKKYLRISYRNDDGEWVPVDLNFSSIKIKKDGKA